MLKHLVMWKFNQSYSLEQSKENARQIKIGLEDLVGVIPEIVSLKVYIDCLPNSSFEVVLDSVFANEADLQSYMTHPEHVKLSNKVKMYFQDRHCIDYIL